MDFSNPFAGAICGVLILVAISFFFSFVETVYAWFSNHTPILFESKGLWVIIALFAMMGTVIQHFVQFSQGG